jgi:hypothetical protein
MEMARKESFAGEGMDGMIQDGEMGGRERK